MSTARGRLVAVSNRAGPLPGGAAAAGGLAVALVAALRESGGLWFGWSGRVGAATRHPQLREGGGMTLATLDLSPSDHEGYYSGFSNRCLWPLLHFRIDLSHYDAAEYAAYRRVNKRFARELAPLLEPGDRIWVHDYHLYPLARELRALGVTTRIGFFQHVPFPPRDIFDTLPVHEDLARALFDYDLVGFQTEPDLQRFCDYVEHEARGTVFGIDHVRAFSRDLSTGAFPIGIDVEGFRALAGSARVLGEVARQRAALDGRVQVIGVDRLDYSKGLLRRLSAYEHLLERHPEVHGRVDFLQVAPVSRGELADYRDFRSELERAAARVNDRYARLDWTPVRCLMQALPRATVAALYRASRAALVTPVRDGMNLVAKEYVAAQDPADPGVLVLSRFAGAALQMEDALLVNPYDAAATADALRTALAMPLEERRARHARLLEGLVRNDVRRWRDDFIARLDASGPRTLGAVSPGRHNPRRFPGELRTLPTFKPLPPR